MLGTMRFRNKTFRLRQRHILGSPVRARSNTGDARLARIEELLTVLVDALAQDTDEREDDGERDQLQEL